MFAFDAEYDHVGAAQAERAFYLRSVFELRRMQTLLPPFFFVVVVAAGVWLQATSWFITFFSVALFLSVAGPVFFYFARPAAAGRLARKYPVRQVSLTAQAIEVTAGDHKATVPWGRVKYVWEAGDYLLLVLGKFGNISIPRRSLPSGAQEFILGSIGNAA